MQLPHTHARPHTHTRGWAVLWAMTARGQSYSTNGCKRAAFYLSRAGNIGVHVEKSWSSHDGEVLSLLLCLQEKKKSVLFRRSSLDYRAWPLTSSYDRCSRCFNSPRPPTETHDKKTSYLIKNFQFAAETLVEHILRPDFGSPCVPARRWRSRGCSTCNEGFLLSSHSFRLLSIGSSYATKAHLIISSEKQPFTPLMCSCRREPGSALISCTLFSPPLVTNRRRALLSWGSTSGRRPGERRRKASTLDPERSGTLGGSGMDLLCWTDRARVQGCCWGQRRGGAPRPAGGCTPGGRSSELSCSGNWNTNILPVHTNASELWIPTLHGWL